jgi:hypothetical protein
MDWEIWLANVYFEEDPLKSKRRPVVVVPDGSFIKVFKVTTHVPRDDYDYPLKKWSSAGLRGESVVRMDKVIVLLQGDLIHKIGKLHPIDIFQIKSILTRFNINI